MLKPRSEAATEEILSFEDEKEKEKTNKFNIIF